MQVIHLDSAAEFARSLSKVLVHEGGYSSHPEDPGGATMSGVTQRVYDQYRRTHCFDPIPVKNVSNSEMQAIYKKRYWDQIKGDKLAPGVSYVVFDCAGVAQSVKWLQRVLQAMGLYQDGIDGVIGQGTLLAAASVNDNDALVAGICECSMAFLKALKTFKTFGKGWTARVNGVRAVGQAWATGSVGPEVEYIVGGDAKAFISEAKPAPPLGAADGATGGGVGSGGIALTLEQVRDQLAPLRLGTHRQGSDGSHHPRCRVDCRRHRLSLVGQPAEAGAARRSRPQHEGGMVMSIGDAIKYGVGALLGGLVVFIVYSTLNTASPTSRKTSPK